MRMRVEPCLMMEKIEWYQEVLKLDPDSKVFFPLAQLLRESRQPEKAIEVLRLGLRHTSMFLEARLLLIQLLFEQSRVDECRAELSAVTGLLENYPAFWEVWADSVAGKNKDLALAIRLMASTIRHPEYSLSLILESGLELLQDVRRTFSAAPATAAGAETEAPSGAMPAEPRSADAPEPPLAAPFAGLEHLHDHVVPVEREHDDIAGAHGMGGLADVHAVDADIAGFDGLRGQRARLAQAREEQPLVDALSRLTCRLFFVMRHGLTSSAAP